MPSGMHPPPHTHTHTHINSEAAMEIDSEMNYFCNGNLLQHAHPDDIFLL